MGKNEAVRDQKTSTILYVVSALLLFASPIVWMLVPNLFSDALCNPGPTGTGCGYANIGLNAYGALSALVLALCGIALLVAGWLKARKSKAGINTKNRQLLVKKRSFPYLKTMKISIVLIIGYISLYILLGATKHFGFTISTYVIAMLPLLVLSFFMAFGFMGSLRSKNTSRLDYVTVSIAMGILLFSLIGYIFFMIDVSVAYWA